MRAGQRPVLHVENIQKIDVFIFLNISYAGSLSIFNIENTCIHVYFLQMIQDLFPCICLNVHVTT